jgi:hypothetical protein
MEMHRFPRRALLGSAPIGLSVAIVLAARPAPAFQKLSQADARYEGTAKGSQHCVSCLHFQPPHGCKFVQGEISPDGWCQLFTKRAGA